jgi:hypothetical protein
MDCRMQLDNPWPILVSNTDVYVAIGGSNSDVTSVLFDQFV